MTNTQRDAAVLSLARILEEITERLWRDTHGACGGMTQQSTERLWERCGKLRQEVEEQNR